MNSSCKLCDKKVRILKNSIYKSYATKEGYSLETKLLLCSYCDFIQRKRSVKLNKILLNVYKQDYGFKTKDTHITVVNGKAISRNEIRSKFIGSLLKSLNVRSGSHLDIGGGDGQFSLFFKKNNKSWKTSVFEVNKKRLNEFKFKNFYRIYSGNLNKIKQKFQLITFFHVLEHVTNPLQFLQTARNLLSKDGIIICVIPSYEKVNSDFFILEHLNFFSQKTLDFAAISSGLQLLNKSINFLANSEIGFVAKKSNEKVIALNKIKSTEKLLNFVRHIYKKYKKKLCIFGFGGTGLSLGPQVRKFIECYVDENKSLFEKRHYNIPIKSLDDLKKNSIVVVPLNNRNQSEKIVSRLKKKYKYIKFIIPNLM